MTMNENAPVVKTGADLKTDTPGGAVEHSDSTPETRVPAVGETWVRRPGVTRSPERLRITSVLTSWCGVEWDSGGEVVSDSWQFDTLRRGYLPEVGNA
jgi:hypothetical protein